MSSGSNIDNIPLLHPASSALHCQSLPSCFYSSLVYIVYRYTFTCIYTGLATVVFFYIAATVSA